MADHYRSTASRCFRAGASARRGVCASSLRRRYSGGSWLRGETARLLRFGEVLSLLQGTCAFRVCSCAHGLRSSFVQLRGVGAQGICHTDSPTQPGTLLCETIDEAVVRACRVVSAPVCTTTPSPESGASLVIVR